jgi:hypothetical protein
MRMGCMKIGLPRQERFAQLRMAMLACCVGSWGMQEMPAQAKQTSSHEPAVGIASISDDIKAIGFTAAHRTLAMGTLVVVADWKHRDREVCVAINDRGPYVRKKGHLVKERFLDLSPLAAQAIGLTPRSGVMRVVMRVVNACPGWERLAPG